MPLGGDMVDNLVHAQQGAVAKVALPHALSLVDEVFLLPMRAVVALQILERALLPILVSVAARHLCEPRRRCQSNKERPCALGARERKAAMVKTNKISDDAWEHKGQKRQR